MSRSRQRVEVLRQISAIREISKRLAEAKCVAANRDAMLAKDKQQQQQDYLNEAVSGWEDAMAAQYFDPDGTIFWGHAINQASLAVDVAASDTEQCAAILEHAEKHMAGMIANVRSADTLLTKARKKYSYDVENRHLAEQADQITRLEMRR
jgi:hypothetical protein